MNTGNQALDPIAHAKRRGIASRRIGIGNACACGEDRSFALIGGSQPMNCEECDRRRNGHSIFDNHHVAGKANHPLTVPIRANDHNAILSEAQRAWPRATRENPDGSPLLAGAGCIRGFVDTVKYLMDKLLLWIAQFLEKLDAFLRSHLGPKWWTKKEFVEFTTRSREQ